jgi:glycosyltransferase involved in cell wall biosynthesis
MSVRPHVTIGLPVYQGERYVDEAIQSIRAQTFRDFELIIADNGSTDGTEAICRRHVAEDPRISYCRSPVNRGASWNFSRLVDLAHGELFKWASHDDLLMPEYIEHCVRCFERDPDVVLCHTGAATIDEQSRVVRRWPLNPNAAAGRPSRRFADVVLREGPCFPIFGLIRLDVLRTTGLLGPFNSHDRPLLAELALRGRYVQIPDVLFLNREHQDRSIRAYRGPHDRIAWFDPSLADRIVYSNLRLLLEYYRAIVRSGVPTWDAVRSELTLARWTLSRAQPIVREVLRGVFVLAHRTITHHAAAPHERDARAN